MDNPFLDNGYLSLNASINKVIIAKMPTDKVREDYTGKSAMDIFSTALFIDEIKNKSFELGIDLKKAEEKKLPQYLNICLESSDEKIQNTAKDIAELFGERLGVILLTLKKGERENRINRSDWNDDNWEYWKQIKNVILVGGLSSGRIGVILKQCIEKVFYEAGEDSYNIILNQDSADIGIKGCASLISNPQNNCQYIVLDCGQTFVKRSFVKIQNEGDIDIEVLEKVPSDNVEWESDSKDEALKLHKHIAEIICETVRTAQKRNIEIGNEMVISIANYVKEGIIADRGGYGKLRLLGDNYEKYLSDDLYKKLNIRFKIELIHDGSAIAAAFSKYEDSVCISLGTAFGVGYPSKLFA